MSEKMKISVIVPVFNVEDYLDECVMSILNQTHNNIELVLVDDGSTDASGKICDKYAIKDDRVKVLHKKNGGVSEARNNGIELASGDYIAFVDADDFIEADMYEDLLSLSIKNGADICISNIFIRTNNYSYNSDEVQTFLYNGKEAINRFLSFRFYGKDFIPTSLCTGLYKSSIVKNEKFPNNIHHYEDFYMQSLYITNANSVIATNKPYYHYRVREGSAHHVGLSEKNLTCLNIADELKERSILSLMNDYRNVKSFFIAGCSFKMMMSYPVSKDKFNHVYGSVKKNICAILLSKSVNWKQKCCLLAFLLSPERLGKTIGNYLKSKQNNL